MGNITKKKDVCIMKIYYTIIDSIIGKIKIAFSKKGIVRLSFPNESIEKFINILNNNYNNIVKVDHSPIDYEDKIDKYLKGELKEFNIPVILKGTEFQIQVWDELRKIPYGETRTYKEIAIAIQRKKAYRAIGQACNKNPIPLIVPCHRVIGSSGALIGFGGGIKLKERLLRMEKRNI